MVMRKEEPEPQADLVPAPLSKANPPYPITPLDEHPPAIAATSSTTPGLYSSNVSSSPAFDFKTPNDTTQPKYQKAPLEEESESSEDEWNRSDDDDFEQVNAKDIPDALKPAGGKTPVKSAPLPDALRVGPSTGIPIRKPIENISPMPTGASSASYGAMSTVSEQSNGSLPLQTNNPYLNMQPTGKSNWGGESSQQIWGDSQSQAAKYGGPVELPAYSTPSTPAHELANLNLNHQIPPVPNTKSADQPPLIAVDAPTTLTSPRSEQPTPTRKASNPWSTEVEASLIDAAPGTIGLPQDDYSHAGPPAWHQQQQDWEQSGKERKEREEAAQRADEAENRVEQPVSTNPFVPPQPANLPPPPPVSQDEEQAPVLPPRPINTAIASNATPGPESPNSRMNRQRKEHYQIKQIRWHDVNEPGIRTSPILTQNLNGPCPLLALVNALVLSTPAGIDTALVETLRTRETVSLGLLLDAVFDELMSGRRGTAAQELPDVSDLYKFLLALHTGLNVNPMFVPDIDATYGNSALTDSPASRAGGFENTQDMKLYRTFNIPLMHGWLPETDSEAAAAFNRVARSYETSQYVQFQEEDLEAKLQSGDPLTPEEQQMFTDILTIKEFLQKWPTQLTDHGLKVLQSSLQTGQVAILFRNDHFSTLFKDPRTGKLFILVTDQGYSSHDEIVWESLVDVHGQGSELFSGDFRPVGNHSAAPQQTQQAQTLLGADNGQGWTTVEPRRGNQQRSPSVPGPDQSNEISHDGLSRAEQEDHDLALALQLQEEEEDRQRRETVQRERDNQASETAIAAHSQARPENPRISRIETPPIIPPRRNNITGHRPTTDPAPPPTYEEASTARPYHPPQGHPASPQAPIPPQGSAYQANNPNRPPQRPMGPGRPVGSPPMGRPGRRHSAGQNGEEQREKCVVM